MTMARDTGPTRPDTITTPRRRGLLTGTIAALLTGTAAVATARAASLPAAGDDAELIILCDRLVAWEAKYDAIYLGIDDDDAADRAAQPILPEYD
jgi:hypothetical protein